MEINILTQKIIDAAMAVHHILGPGLLDSVYKASLAHHLGKHESLDIELDKPIPLVYKTCIIDCSYIADLLVENKVIVVIKSEECLNDIDTAQLATYVKVGNFQSGLLINFNVILLKNGIKRIAY